MSQPKVNVLTCLGPAMDEPIRVFLIVLNGMDFKKTSKCKCHLFYVNVNIYKHYPE